MGSTVMYIDMINAAIGGIFERKIEQLVLGLGKVDGSDLLVRVVFPANADVGMARGVEPLVEKCVKVPAADRVDNFFEIFGAGVAIPINGVIGGQTLPEKAVADTAAKHV